MRTLPDNPHLDHLRQQAKDLLAGLREAEPSTSLSDAQTALARQYGFRTWTELKAEADRLRGGADIADDALAQAIASRYALGRVSGNMRSLAPANETGRPLDRPTVGPRCRPGRRRNGRAAPGSRGTGRRAIASAGAKPEWSGGRIHR
jgi:hypothetical protein